MSSQKIQISVKNHKDFTNATKGLKSKYYVQLDGVLFQTKRTYVSQVFTTLGFVRAEVELQRFPESNFQYFIVKSITRI